MKNYFNEETFKNSNKTPMNVKLSVYEFLNGMLFAKWACVEIERIEE